jgi:NADH-quinone oxidoreductase subunit F
MRLREFEAFRLRAMHEWQEMHSRPFVTVGTATCGRGAGALATLDVVREFVSRHKVDCNVIEVGCMGLCYAEPILGVGIPGTPTVFYGKVGAEEAYGILEQHLLYGKPVAQYALGAVGDGSVDGIQNLFESPIFRKQVRRVLSRCGFIEPTNLDHYIATGGYEGLLKALSMEPMQIIEELKGSGLRGRGGAGFPTGLKWELARKAPGDEKYVICNAAEGDIGAFMDRVLMESDPYSILEGMTIAALAIGARRGYIYVRAEYELAFHVLDKAISRAMQYGLLGGDILGTGLQFEVELFRAAGMYVCGEETALMNSMEGRRGVPRVRPPFPTQAGLRGMPTVVNNVKTLANVPLVLKNGAGWFSSIGTGKSRGTALLSLSGCIERCGVVEVPMGITLREVVYEIGGGIANGRELKAVQTGGPLGGVIPKSMVDLPLDYESLRDIGSPLGSGGIIVLDDRTCMVDVARGFSEFAKKESCGYCAPCRLGTTQIFQILDEITEGCGRPGDIDLLEDIGEAMKVSSFCAFGQNASNVVLATIKHFRDEYEEHIYNGRCPAFLRSSEEGKG